MVLPEAQKKRKRADGDKDLMDSIPDSDKAEAQIIDEDDHLKNLSAAKPSYMTDFNTPNTPEYYQALERFYWRNLSFQNTMYGADLCGSLFTNNEENKWNVSNLENMLSQVNVDVPGVTTPYLYFGMYKATFSWHVEDMDLFSIKYLLSN